MNSIKIRKAKICDIKSISTLLKELGYDTTSSNIELMLEENINEEVYVAVLDEKILGLISVIYFNYFPTAKKNCRITSFVVGEKYRGKGIGTKMISFIEDLALKRGCEVIELTSSFHRIQTHNYYENLGFEKTSYKYIKKLG